MKRISLRLFIILGAFFISLTMASSAVAQQKSDMRPGWGFGDTNHVHVGPPGESVRMEYENKIAYWENLIAIQRQLITQWRELTRNLFRS